MNQIRIGCCGFARGRKEYWERFKLVEIQQTFYKPPSIETAEKWRKEVPKDFEFSLKAWQKITHLPSSPTYRKAGLQIPVGKEAYYGFFRPSEEVFEAWQKTCDVARVLRARTIVFQCPAKFAPTTENVENMRFFFRKINREGFILVWEPRGEWTNDVIATLCQDLDLIHCVDPFKNEPACGNLKYFRLHGGPSYSHQYSDDELAKLRELSDGDAYVLFNNMTMYTDALRFKQLVERSK